MPDVESRVGVTSFTEPVMPIATPRTYELLGLVVRHTPSGFAIECEDADPEVRQLVDEASSSQN